MRDDVKTPLARAKSRKLEMGRRHQMGRELGREPTGGSPMREFLVK